MLQVGMCCLMLAAGSVGVQQVERTQAADSVGEVVDMTFGQTYSGESTMIGTNYKFHMPTSGQLQVPLTRKYEWWLEVYLYDYAGTELYKGEGFGKSQVIQIDLLEGDYTLCIKSNGDYSFTPVFQASNETISEKTIQKNNENSYATALDNLSTQVTGQLAANDNKDIYTFTLSQDQNVTFTVFSSVAKMKFFITDSYGEYSYTSDEFANGTRDFTCAIPAGTYYLTLSDNETGETGTYQFSGRTSGFSAVSLKSVKNVAGKKVKVNWSRNANVSGYQIQIARNGGFTKSVKTINVAGSKNKSQTIANLKKKKKYYVRVRTYTETLKTSATTAVNQKCYSEWSGVKGVKVKK